MRGNVSSYALAVDGIADMIQGNLMPRPSAILSSIVSVTFIGRGRLPRAWLRNTFRVRRDVVRAALVWLKTHNPKYYGGIVIDADRLNNLPEDDIPVEIESIVRQNEELGVVDHENGGYVPEEQPEDGAYQFSMEVLLLMILPL